MVKILCDAKLIETMVESSGLLVRHNQLDTTTSSVTNALGASNVVSGGGGASKCGVLETRVRGAWYRVTVTLESDYLSVSLDETCDPIDHTTTLNGTLG